MAKQIFVNLSVKNLNKTKKFFSQLGFYKRIVSVGEVDIKQAADSAQEAGRSIDASFKVTVFFMSQENLERMTAKKPLAPPAAQQGKKAASAIK